MTSRWARKFSASGQFVGLPSILRPQLASASITLASVTNPSRQPILPGCSANHHAFENTPEQSAVAKAMKVLREVE
jgi:hypothetical protein